MGDLNGFYRASHIQRITLDHVIYSIIQSCDLADLTVLCSTTVPGCVMPEIEKVGILGNLTINP